MATEVGTRVSGCGSTPWCRSAGTTSATAARYRVALPAPAAVTLKVCFSRRTPPTTAAAPNTSRRLPMIDPVSEAFTTSSSPARRAAKARISSAAFPSPAERIPPSPVPTRAARDSVARPMSPASGTTARQESTKAAVDRSGQARWTAMAAGTKMRSVSRGWMRGSLTARECTWRCPEPEPGAR